MSKSNIIILATFWNEIEWIEASLAQIERIDPIEIIICDGNFDPSVKNRSTDGTREKIEQFLKKTKIPSQMISAIRIKNNLFKGINILKHSGCTKLSGFNLGRLKVAAVSQIKTNIYRVNQALTFAHMCRLSKKWQIGNWVMTYDADQFYSDELIDSFSATVRKDFNYDLIAANELTFPYSFSQFTKEYENRTWNNLPHKIKNNMAIYPTRHFMIERSHSAINYQDDAKIIHSGLYHHYKFRKNKKRIEDGYNLGDRKPPNIERYKNLQTMDKSLLPTVIKKIFKI